LPFVPAVRVGAVELEGYSLHAGVRIEGDDRDGLEKLCRPACRAASGAAQAGTC